MKTIDVEELVRRLSANDEWAFFDVREAGEIHEGHIPGSTPLPRRMIELQIEELVPRRSTPIVLCDDSGTRAQLAAGTLVRAGYSDVAILEGGIAAWARQQGELEHGKNVPSKAFAEHMFEQGSIPQVTAMTLKEWMDTGKPHVVVDIRAADEHVLGHVPTAANVPGVELTRIAADLSAAAKPVIVHCAGRTRSIVACRTLKDLGVEQAFALKDGTMGWTLAGYALEKTQAVAAEASPASIARGEQRSRALAIASGATYVAARDAAAKLQARSRGELNCYVIDVRQPEAYAQGHVKGVKSVAGGQAVLFADEHVAVRSAEIVFVDGGEGQAALTACWFRRLGYPRVSVVEGGIAALVAAGCELERGRIRAKPLQIDETRRRTKQVDVAAASAALQSTTAPTVLDVGTSKSYAAGHLPNSAWIPRGWLEAHVREAVARADAPVLVVCQNGIQSTYAAATLASLGYSDVSVLEGGLARWKQAGLPLEKGKPASTAFGSDVVKSPYERTKADMESYLAWERQLAAKNA